MIKLSSGFTIFFKFFLPVFWVVFFGSLIAAVFFSLGDEVYVGTTYFKSLLVAGYVGWSILLYFTVFKLKRVEGNMQGLFISNYFKHIQLPFSRIKEFNETHLGVFILVKVKFTEKTYFGKSIYFLASVKRFEEFVKINAHQLKKDLSIGD